MKISIGELKIELTKDELFGLNNQKKEKEVSPISSKVPTLDLGGNWKESLPSLFDFEDELLNPYLNASVEILEGEELEDFLDGIGVDIDSIEGEGDIEILIEEDGTVFINGKKHHRKINDKGKFNDDIGPSRF